MESSMRDYNPPCGHRHGRYGCTNEGYCGYGMPRTAADFAEERHAGQKYGDDPYIVHLDQVVHQAARALGRLPTPLREHGRIIYAACWLHDVVEDGRATLDEVLARFGEEVAAIVWACTVEGKNRTEKGLDLLSRFRVAARFEPHGLVPNGAETWRPVFERSPWLLEAAQMVKLCDRVANVENCRRTHDSRLSMYHGEHTSFCSGLQVQETEDPAISALLAELDALL